MPPSSPAFKSIINTSIHSQKPPSKLPASIPISNTQTKMKTSAIFFSLLASALAAPSVPRDAPSIAFALVNDQTGANQRATVVANNVPVRFGTAFANTNLVQNGRVIATSLMSTSINAAVTCDVKDGAQTLKGQLSERVTFIDLDGVQGAAIPTDVTDFTITCH